MSETACRYCKSSDFVSWNYTERRKIVVAEGEPPVHFGCFLHWLIDDAITRNFPNISRREVQVLKHRIGAPEPGAPSLKPLVDVGKKMGWTRSMRASQVQNSAMSRLPKKIQAAKSEAEKQVVAERTLREPVEAAQSFIEAAAF